MEYKKKYLKYKAKYLNIKKKVTGGHRMGRGYNTSNTKYHKPLKTRKPTQEELLAEQERENAEEDKRYKNEMAHKNEIITYMHQDEDLDKYIKRLTDIKNINNYTYNHANLTDNEKDTIKNKRMKECRYKIAEIYKQKIEEQQKVVKEISDEISNTISYGNMVRKEVSDREKAEEEKLEDYKILLKSYKDKLKDDLYATQDNPEDPLAELGSIDKLYEEYKSPSDATWTSTIVDIIASHSKKDCEPDSVSTECNRVNAKNTVAYTDYYIDKMRGVEADWKTHRENWKRDMCPKLKKK